MRAFALYAASCLVIVALLGAIAWGVTDGGDGAPEAHRVILVSAALAIAVQLVAFAAALLLRRRNLMLGWGLGSVLRFVVLVLFALAVASLWRAALAPALLSFVAFLFVTTVVEPIFLRYR